jgi:hypothetical protein
MCVQHDERRLKHKEKLRVDNELNGLEKVGIVEQRRYALILCFKG